MLGISFLTEMAPRPSCSTDGARAAEGKSGGVLAFLKSEALHPADFTIREDGVVRLNPELARRVAASAHLQG
jgi:hypothetical protein